MNSYFEEFEKKYNRPQMDRVTVGFSGIDPAPKNSGDLISDDVVETTVAEKLEARVATSDEVDAVLSEIWD